MKRFEHSIRRYLFIILLLFVLYLGFLVIRPFIGAAVIGALLAFLFHPIYRWLARKTRMKSLSAFLVSLAFVILAAGLVLFVVTSATSEARSFYSLSKQKIYTGNYLDIKCPYEGEDPSILCVLTDYTRELSQDPNFRKYSESALNKISSFILEEGSSMIFRIPRFILEIFVAIFIMYYLLKDGRAIINRIKTLLPVKKSEKESIVKGFGQTVGAIFYAQVLIALIQGTLGGIGFWVVGISSPVLWGAIMVLFAFIPMFGTALVWFPASLILIMSGYANGDYLTVWKGVGLLIYRALIVGTIDNLLKPRLIGRKTGVHPVLVLLGILGGLEIFGFIGFILGPLIL